MSLLDETHFFWAQNFPFGCSFHRPYYDWQISMLPLYKSRKKKKIKMVKKLSQKRIDEKLGELRALLDSFTGQTIPKDLIEPMKALHKELIDKDYQKKENRVISKLLEWLRR